MGRMGQIICPKESTTCRERDDASMFHVEHPEGSISEQAGGRWAARSSKSLGEPAGVVALTLRSPTRSRESRIGERWRVSAYCLLPTAYCLLLYYLDPLECEAELCPPPPPPDAA